MSDYLQFFFDFVSQRGNLCMYLLFKLYLSRSLK